MNSAAGLKTADEWLNPEALSRVTKAQSRGQQVLESAGLVPEASRVAVEVERHRWAWKPERVRVVLIAESHVHTSESDLAIRIRSEYLPQEVRQIPSSFVRLVYCLGYGEDELLTSRPQRRNSGTWQYWDLFGQLAETSPRLRGHSLSERLHWKLQTLKELSRRGVWLLDSCLHGIYEPGGNRLGDVTTELHRTWLEEYGSWLLSEVKPNLIWCIGKGVARNLSELGLKADGWIYQPNARIENSLRCTSLKQLVDACQ